MMPKYWFVQKNFETLCCSSSSLLHSLTFCLPSDCSCKLSKYLSITAMTNGSFFETEVSKQLTIFFMLLCIYLFWMSFPSLFSSNVLVNPLVWINSIFLTLDFCSYLACRLLSVIGTVRFKMNDLRAANTLILCSAVHMKF